MFRVDQVELQRVIMARLAREPKKVRRRWAEGFYYDYNEEVLAHLVHEVLDEVFAHDGVLVRPDPTVHYPPTTSGSSNPVRKHGQWDETEPWPEIFGPRPTQI